MILQLNAKLKETSLFVIIFGQKTFVSGQQIQNTPTCNETALKAYRPLFAREVVKYLYQ